MVEDITVGDSEAIAKHRLFFRGNTMTPARFWVYALFNIDRPFDAERLERLGYMELNLLEAIKTHNGVSYSLLQN